MKVICLINTRNHSQFIDECVQSCLAQQVPVECDYEVHAIDAGSTDGTLEILQNYQNRLTLYPRANIGQSGAFNLCMELDADIFMFCDGDDCLHPDRLRHIVNVFSTHQDVVMVGNSINEVDASGNLIRRVFVESDQYLDVSKLDDAERLYAARCLLGTSRLAVRKPDLVRILPYYRTVLFEADEYVFNLLPNFGKVCILSAPLTDYRLHSANNYQSSKPSLKRTQIYRQVHEELLTCMIVMRNKHGLVGCYIDLCERGLRDLCNRTFLLEDALKSRSKAVNIILREPNTLGLVRAAGLRRSFYAAIVLTLGLLAALSVHYFLRSLVGKLSAVTGKVADARLL